MVILVHNAENFEFKFSQVSRHLKQQLSWTSFPLVPSKLSATHKLIFLVLNNFHGISYFKWPGISHGQIWSPIFNNMSYHRLSFSSLETKLQSFAFQLKSWQLWKKIFTLILFSKQVLDRTLSKDQTLWFWQPSQFCFPKLVVLSVLI